MLPWQDQILNLTYKIHSAVILWLGSLMKDYIYHMSRTQIYVLMCHKVTFCCCSVALIYDMHYYFSDFSPSCEDVSGFVGKEVNLTCKVSRLINNCCIITYMIKCPDIKNDTATCKKVTSCEQSKSFTCSYTPTTAMTENCSLFVQTTCGTKSTKFTVNIAGIIFEFII